MVDFTKYKNIDIRIEMFDPTLDLLQPELKTEVTTGSYKHTRQRNNLVILRVLVKSVMVQWS